jgi:microcystin degradation protein MlrC
MEVEARRRLGEAFTGPDLERRSPELDVASGMAWTAADFPDQSGRIAVVTGANGGLGLEVARELVRKMLMS